MAESADFELNLKDKVSKPAKKAGKGLTEVEKAWKRLERLQQTAEPRAAIRAFNRQERAAERAAKGMNKMSRATKGVGAAASRLAPVAGAAAAAIAVMGAGAFVAQRKIIGAGASFEQAITNVAAVGLTTRENIAGLEEKAKSLGETTKFTATESANAMEIMAKAGFKQNEILSGVDGVLNAAAASGLEMAEVADHVSNVLKGMGLNAGEATRVADVLALASSRTTSTIGSLGESMRNVAATARQFNIPLEDTVAGVALLQDVGLDASVAGSSMNTMLTKLAKPTDEIARKMEKFGVTFQDAHGNMLPLPGVMKNMAKAADESGGNMEVVAFFADLVGLRGQKAALNLKDIFASGRFDELADELEGAAGSAEQMAETRMDTLIGDWTKLKSKIEGVAIELFGIQATPLREIVQQTTEWVEANKGLVFDKFNNFVDVLVENKDVIIGTMKAIGSAFEAMFTVMEALGKVGATAVRAQNVGLSIGEEDSAEQIRAMEALGGDWLAGFMRGIQNNLGPARAQVRSGFESIMRVVERDVFGINSPSKEGIAIGENFTGSIGSGMENMRAMVEKQSRGVAIDAIMGVQVAANDNRGVRGVTAEATSHRLASFDGGGAGNTTTNKVEVTVPINVNGTPDAGQLKDMSRMVEEGVRKALAS